MPHLHRDEIRQLFSAAMSAMYREEVPAYGELMGLVSDVNAQTLAQDPGLRTTLENSGELSRIDDERHGAIRLGTTRRTAYDPAVVRSHGHVSGRLLRSVRSWNPRPRHRLSPGSGSGAVVQSVSGFHLAIAVGPDRRCGLA